MLSGAIPSPVSATEISMKSPLDSTFDVRCALFEGNSVGQRTSNALGGDPQPAAAPHRLDGVADEVPQRLLRLERVDPKGGGASPGNRPRP
jgi:hypothetical protein